jgi:hypothetical protein
MDDETEEIRLDAEARATGNKFRYMTKAEEAALAFRYERDLIHRDWVEAEKVVAAARTILGSEGDAADFVALERSLLAYDTYLAADPEGRTWKAKAAEQSGLPERGLVSTGASVKGSRRDA